jgi:hypothetical protein
MPTTTQDHTELQELVFGAPAAVAPAAGRRGRELSPELVDGAVDGAGDRRRVRQALGMGSERISDELIDELLAGASTRRRSLGPAGCWRS